QTRDHSLTQVAVDTGDIKPSKMRFHKDRNKLTKALGIQSNLNVKERYDPIEMMPGDSILMCTDGFWEYIDEKQMCKTLKKTDTAQEWMNTMLRVISKNIRKGNDNLTAIVAKIID
ncbi:MAG: SpoIIE family protein phosphatase, partial [Lachnospiraceae bacterium]|nr:SpoIIE family protein phosphatase [Lachnospiraceae bacterium]